MPRIGFLGAASPAEFASRLDALRAGLQDFGYVEGRNVSIEYRWAEGKFERFPELAADLVRLNVDVILTNGILASRAAKGATRSIPVVAIGVGDPVSSGLVVSLGRPGGNVTGTAIFSDELAVKRMELLKAVLPAAQRLATLLNPDNTGNRLAAMESGAQALGIQLLTFHVRTREDVAGAFSGMIGKRAQGVVFVEEPLFNTIGGELARLALGHKLPSIGLVEQAESGCLLAYGVHIESMYRRSGYFVERILKGTKPADLPVERPTTFQLAVNMKTANTLGIKIPQSIMVQATRVIE